MPPQSKLSLALPLPVWHKVDMKQLKKWRLAHPELKTQDDVAKLFGVCAVTVCRYETGQRKIEPKRVRLISSITGIPPHVLRPDIFPAPSQGDGVLATQ